MACIFSGASAKSMGGLASDSLPQLPSMSSAALPSEETLESIGSEIEKRLDSESGTIMDGFRSMVSRMDQDFSASGMKTLHEIEESLGKHTESLQQQFKAMTEQMRKGMDHLMESAAGSDTLRDMKSGTNGTANMFSTDYWKNLFSRN